MAVKAISTLCRLSSPNAVGWEGWVVVDGLGVGCWFCCFRAHGVGLSWFLGGEKQLLVAGGSCWLAGQTARSRGWWPLLALVAKNGRDCRCKLTALYLQIAYNNLLTVEDAVPGAPGLVRGAKGVGTLRS